MKCCIIHNCGIHYNSNISAVYLVFWSVLFVDVIYG